jgi:pyruvate,water dikinase
MGASPFQNDHLVWLESASHGPELVGGKGASLGRLVALGAPVPPAIGLTTHAYRAFVTALGLPSLPSGLTGAELGRTRSLMEESLLSPTVADLLAHAYAALEERLGAGVELAVRSSAIDEDSAAHSFAGLHDTILGVRGPAAFETAVRRCWASLWTERAMSYRATATLEAEIAIAVVAQQMVRCDVSFVAFTADPVSGSEDRLLIDAAWGLGEAIVSGVVNPDHVVIGADGEIVDYRIGDKRLMVIPDDSTVDGIRAVPVPRAMCGLPALTAAQAIQIASICRSLSARLGHPADIEGGFAGDTLHIFQSRPITTLAPRVDSAVA